MIRLPMSVSNDTKRWLQRNKVFFETIAALLLSVMAVLVSFFQACVATRQTRLISLQTRVVESQVVPQFFLEVLAPPNNNVDANASRLVGVVNRGGGAHEIDVSTSEFITMTCRRKGRRRTVRIPVEGYSELTALLTEGTGEITTVLVSPPHTTHLFELMTAVTDLDTTDSHREVTGIEIMVFLEYKDVLGRAHSEYFSVHHPDMLILRHIDAPAVETTRGELNNKRALPYDSVTAERLVALVDH
jgi:hypothetical protein